MTRYALLHPLREPQETKTRSEAWLMSGHTAMVMVEGVAGGVMVESVKPPNDPKLSDGGGWRSPCAGAGGWGRRRWEAWAVTAGAVRCSAWLGVAVEFIWCVTKGV